MGDPADGDWRRRYDRSLDESRADHDRRSFGPPPAQEPEWLGRRGMLPSALRRDHLVVHGRGDSDDLARRTEEARKELEGFATPVFDGARLRVRTCHFGRADFFYPVFDGWADARNGEVKVIGVLRPGPLAWPTVLVSMVMPIAAVVPGVANRLVLAAVGSATFIVFTDGLVIGRKRNRRRRAQIVMAVEHIGGGGAHLRTRMPHAARWPAGR